MSKKIDDLSKDELLTILYHLVPTTLTGEHLCDCFCCYNGVYKDDKSAVLYPNGHIEMVDVYWYECDSCQALNEEDN